MENGKFKRETNRQRAKREAKSAQSKRQMTRRAFLIGGVSLATLGGVGYLATQVNEGKNVPILPPESPEASLGVDIVAVTNLAIDDFEAVSGGLTLDRNTIINSTSFKNYNESGPSIDRTGEQGFSAAEVTNDVPPKIHISSQFIEIVPPADRIAMTRAILNHELVHYDGLRYEDVELGTNIFSQYPATKEKSVKGVYIRGFKVVGKSSAGQDFSVFNQLEEAAAFMIGNFITQERNVLPDNHVYFKQQGFQDESASLRLVMDKVFPNFGEGIKQLVALRRQPDGLAQFATLLGEKLGWENQEARNIGLSILSSVNAGSIDRIREGLAG